MLALEKQVLTGKLITSPAFWYLGSQVCSALDSVDVSLFNVFYSN